MRWAASGSNNIRLCSIRRVLRVFLLVSAIVATLSSGCSRRPPPLPPPATVPTPAPPPPPSTVSDETLPLPVLEVRIEPKSVSVGESAVLTWQSQNSTAVTIDPAIGQVDINGRIKIFPDQSSTYTVTASGPGGAVSQSVTIEVTGLAGGSGSFDEEDLMGLSIGEQFSMLVKPVFFGFNSAELSENSKKVLDQNIQWLTRLENRELSFVLEGHADERGSEEYNLALGDKRAVVVKQYLLQHGIEASRMKTVSMGEERPFETAQNEAGYAQNRRTHFVLTP